MPPYEPKYLKDAKQALYMAEREYVRMVDVLEEKWQFATHEQIVICEEMIEKQRQLVNALDDKVSAAYDRWQSEQARTLEWTNREIDWDKIDPVISPSELRRYKGNEWDDPMITEY